MVQGDMSKIRVFLVVLFFSTLSNVIFSGEVNINNGGNFQTVISSMKNGLNYGLNKTKEFKNKVLSTTSDVLEYTIRKPIDFTFGKLFEVIDNNINMFNFSEEQVQQEQNSEEQDFGPLDFSYKDILSGVTEQTKEELKKILEIANDKIGAIVFKSVYPAEDDLNNRIENQDERNRENLHPLTIQINTLKNVEHILTVTHGVVSSLKKIEPKTLRLFLELLLSAPMPVLNSMCLTTQLGPKNVHSVLNGIRNAKKVLTTGNLASLGRFLHEYTKDKQRLDKLMELIIEQDDLLPQIIKVLKKYRETVEQERGDVENPQNQNQEVRDRARATITGTQQIVYLALIISLFYNFRDKEPIRSFITRVRSKLPDKKFVFRFPISIEGNNANPKAKK